MLFRSLYSELSQFPEIELFSEPDLSVVAFRWRGKDAEICNRETLKLFHHVLEEGKIHFSSTTLHGFLYLRMCVLSFRTHRSEIQLALKEIRDSISYVKTTQGNNHD